MNKTKALKEKVDSSRDRQVKMRKSMTPVKGESPLQALKRLTR